MAELTSQEKADFAQARGLRNNNGLDSGHSTAAQEDADRRAAIAAQQAPEPEEGEGEGAGADA